MTKTVDTHKTSQAWADIIEVETAKLVERHKRSRDQADIIKNDNSTFTVVVTDYKTESCQCLLTFDDLDSARDYALGVLGIRDAANSWLVYHHDEMTANAKRES
jgi:hypothetical protein